MIIKEAPVYEIKPDHEVMIDTTINSSRIPSKQKPSMIHTERAINIGDR